MTDLLLVDDKPNFRVGLAANLRSAGFSVVVAVEPGEGLKLAKEIQPGLILYDSNMAGTDGQGFERSLISGKANAAIPLQSLANVPDPAAINSGLSPISDDFMLQSLDFVELIAQTQALLKRKNYAEMLANPAGRQLMKNLAISLPASSSIFIRTCRDVLLHSLGMLANQQAPVDQYLDYARKSAYRLKVALETLGWMVEYDRAHYPSSGEQLDLDYSFYDPINEVFEIWHARQLKLNLRVNPGLTLFTPARVFSQVICHLLDNACKFSPPGGWVQVTLQANGPDDLLFTVQDQGPGIPADRREAVFDRFACLSGQPGQPENQGMGLGLFMARSFAKTQAGTVNVLSTATGCKVGMTLKNKPYRFNSNALHRR